jgi:hypothetical protein
MQQALRERFNMEMDRLKQSLGALEARSIGVCRHALSRPARPELSEDS